MHRLLETIRHSVILLLLFTIGFFTFLWYFEQFPIYETYVYSYILYYGAACIGSLSLGWMYSRNPWIQQHSAIVTRWLGIAAAFFACCIIWTACISYLNYGEYIDLSYYHSFLQQVSLFHIPLVWDTGVPVWSQHISPFLFFFVPWYWFGVHAGFLVFIQALLAVGTAVPLYFCARKLTKSSIIGVCMIWAYLLFGGIQSSIYYGFHEVTFFPLLFFSVCWAWVSKRYRLFLLFLILMVFIKEEIAFIAVFFGIFLLCLRQQKYGWTAIGVGILWYICAFQFISYFHHGGYEYWGQFTGGSGGLTGIVRFALTQPVAFFGTWFNDERKPLMLLEVFGSFGFLAVLFPYGWLLLLAPLMMKLLSSDITMMDSFHYSATMTGVMIVATLGTVAYRIPERKRLLVAWFILFMAVCGNIGYGMYFSYSMNPKMTAHTVSFANFWVHSDARERTKVLKTIPSGSVSCQYELCSHIDRGYGLLLPAPGPMALTYMVIDRSLPIPLHTDEEIRTFFDEYVVGKYEILRQEGSILLLRQIRY